MFCYRTTTAERVTKRVDSAQMDRSHFQLSRQGALDPQGGLRPHLSAIVAVKLKKNWGAAAGNASWSALQPSHLRPSTHIFLILTAYKKWTLLRSFFRKKSNCFEKLCMYLGNLVVFVSIIQR